MVYQILTDIIKYFGKFPDRSGVLRNFNRTTEKLSGYDDLKTYFTNLGDPLLPEIKDFVFGTDEKVISTRLDSIASFFLYVELGQIAASSPDNFHNRDTNLMLAITLGHPFVGSDQDCVDDILLSDQCLDLLLQLKDNIIADDDQTCFITRLMENEISINPIEPSLFFNNIGHVMKIEKKSNII